MSNRHDKYRVVSDRECLELANRIDRFVHDWNCRQRACIPEHPDYATATLEQIQQFGYVRGELRRLGVLFRGAPALVHASLRIAPTHIPEWLGPDEDIGIASELPLISRTRVFEVFSAADERPGSTPPVRVGVLELRGNVEATNELAPHYHRFAGAVSKIVSDPLRGAQRGLCLRDPGQLLLMTDLERLAFWGITVCWPTGETPIDVLSQRAYVEDHPTPYDHSSPSLSGEVIRSQIANARRPLLGAEFMGTDENEYRLSLAPYRDDILWVRTFEPARDVFTLTSTILRTREHEGTPTDLISQKQAAGLVPCSARTMQNLLDSGRLTGYGPGRQISRAELMSKHDSLIQRRRRTQRECRQIGAHRIVQQRMQ